MWVSSICILTSDSRTAIYGTVGSLHMSDPSLLITTIINLRDVQRKITRTRYPYRMYGAISEGEMTVAFIIIIIFFCPTSEVARQKI